MGLFDRLRDNVNRANQEGQGGALSLPGAANLNPIQQTQMGARIAQAARKVNPQSVNGGQLLAYARETGRFKGQSMVYGLYVQQQVQRIGAMTNMAINELKVPVALARANAKYTQAMGSAGVQIAGANLQAGVVEASEGAAIQVMSGSSARSREFIN